MKRSAFALLLLATFVASSLDAAPIIVSATFQNGANSYSGAFDRRIDPLASIDQDGSGVDSYTIDGGSGALDDSGARHGMLRFDNFVSAVPVGAKVVSASVGMVTSGVSNAQSGGAYNLYRMNTPFNSGTTWASLGGNGLVGDLGEILGSFDGLAVNTPTSSRADRAVQSWIDGAPNLGFGIRSDRTTDGWQPHTTGATVVANRPILTVDYTVDPLVDVDSYQQGVDSYAGTVDLRFTSSTGGSQDGSTASEGFIDGFNAANASADEPYLVRFNGLALSGFSSIFKAELVMKGGFQSANADSPGPFTVHQMLVDWNLSSTYASFDSDSNPALNGPQELVAGGTIGAAAATVTGINDTEVSYIDVTSIVENWRGGAPNFGFYLGTNGPAGGGTDNGWQVFLSGAADAGFRPELRIIGLLVPEPSSATLLMGLMGGLLIGLSAIGRSRA